MRSFTFDIEKQKKIGYYSGVGSIISFIFFLSLSYLLSLDKYNPLTMTVSKLGITKNGDTSFIIGTVIGAILISIYIRYYLKNTLTNKKFTSLGIVLGVISGIALIGVGVIQDKPEIIFQVMHAISAGIFFFTMGLSIFLISYDLKDDENSSLRLLAYLGFIVCFIAICHFFISFYKENFIIFNIDINIAVVWQKITVGSYVIWHIILLTLLKKQKKLVN
ncbi:MAG: DUF998 domain-containing protein [Candidatus Hodarchaeales archaeon]|jgi:hypothetical protein